MRKVAASELWPAARQKGTGVDVDTTARRSAKGAGAGRGEPSCSCRCSRSRQRGRPPRGGPSATLFHGSASIGDCQTSDTWDQGWGTRGRRGRPGQGWSVACSSLRRECAIVSALVSLVLAMLPFRSAGSGRTAVKGVDIELA